MDLRPFPSVEEARAFRAREAPAAGDSPSTARDVETARDPAAPEGERAAAVERMAKWLASEWRAGGRLDPVLAEEAAHRRRLGDEAATYMTVKREFIVTAAFEAMAEDAKPIALSRSRFSSGRGRSLLPLTRVLGEEAGVKDDPLPEGLYAPGAFGWRDLYRRWLIARAQFRANRRLQAILRKEVVDRRRRAEERAGGYFEEDRLAGRDADATARAEEDRLARLVAALPDDATRQLVRASDPRHQLFMALALGADERGNPLLLHKQRHLLVGWVQHGFDRRRAFEAAGMNYSAGQKVLSRAFKRLEAVGLYAKAG